MKSVVFVVQAVNAVSSVEFVEANRAYLLDTDL